MIEYFIEIINDLFIYLYRINLFNVVKKNDIK